MKLKSLYKSKDDEEDLKKGDKRLKRIHKDVVRRPQTMQGGEMNKELHTPISPVAFVGAAPTGHHGSVR